MRFLVRCPIVTAGLFVLPMLLPKSEPWLIQSTMWSLAVARNFVAAPVQAFGSTFAIGGTRIEIALDCTPMFPTLLLIGGMLTFPSSARAKLIGIAVGTVGLWIYNLVRIYLLMAVLRFAPTWFDAVHVYLWQSVTLLAVVGAFILWVQRTMHAR